MADVDQELMVVRAEYEQVVGKPPAGLNKNRIDLMRKKIEKYKAKKDKPKPPEPKPPRPANTPKPKIERKRPGPAPEPAPRQPGYFIEPGWVG